MTKSHPPLTFAGFWVRLMAHNIDLLFLLPCFYLVSYLLEPVGLVYGVCFGLALMYEVLFTFSKWSGTPGKHLLHLQVRKPVDQRLTLIQCVARTVLKSLTVLTLFFGYAFVVFHPQKKGLHDLAVGSVVILRKAD